MPRTASLAALVFFCGTAFGLPIHTIQSGDLISPLLGTTVSTTGIVTAVDSRGFYMQDPIGDGDVMTSDGIFVYTGVAPLVQVGDAVSVTGRVDEHISSWVEIPGLLSVTEIVRPWSSPLVVEVLSRGNAVPRPVVVGESGRRPPTQLVRPDGRSFWESLEGMLVTVEDAMAVGPRRGSGEVAVVANRGAGATGINARGGLTDGPDDANPEWILLRRDAGIADVTVPFAPVGDLLGDVTGVVGYGMGRYEIYATRPIVHTSRGLGPESSTVPAGPDRVLIASFNVHNLDPRDPARVFADLARQIVENLGSPHVIALQEIQDDDGTPSGGLSDEDARSVSDVVSAAATYARLLDAIVAAGGPRYEVTQVDPEDDRDGGVPGGNIRVGFLYDPARVRLTAPSTRLPGSEDSPGPFDDSRKPLVAEFVVRGTAITVVNVHLTSRFGSVPGYGAGEPIDAGRIEREAQASFVNDWVDGRLRLDPAARIVVLGDLNTFPWESPLTILSGSATGDPALWSLLAGTDPLDRYSFLFGGSSQQLDHALVSASLLHGARPMLDLVHVNTEFYGSPSDHDPILLSLWSPVPEPATVMLFALGLLGLIYIVPPGSARRDEVGLDRNASKGGIRVRV